MSSSTERVRLQPPAGVVVGVRMGGQVIRVRLCFVASRCQASRRHGLRPPPLLILVTPPVRAPEAMRQSLSLPLVA